MNRNDVERILESGMPSERMRVAAYLAERAESSDVPLLVRFRDAETVPRIRSVLATALSRARGTTSTNRRPVVQPVEATDLDAASILQALPGIIRHEMGAAIGWASFSASRTIEAFETTETSRAFDALIKRLDGLVSIAEASRLPKIERISLNELVASCMPPQLPLKLVELQRSGEAVDLIDTDHGLMTLILSNALSNATEAALAIAQPSPVFISHSFTESAFRVTITNNFAGRSFVLDEVSATGVSSKRDGRGLGLYVIRVAAAKLKYEVDLNAAGGIATFTLRGGRRQ